ncbi:hypothetical protein OG802_01260 [Streptomyces sp. NBC_00704]|uniref:hypothetical protein n=1 Tax=Streptomyces sp. NBC_00704 TaxID=2975809 RepID=UPI002E33C414|nr:hypothetical protein [Streptomyces sp. NBC_00704]
MSEAVQGDTTRLQQTGETARAEASATAGQAQQAAGQVAGTAVDQAKAVAGEARQQAGAVAVDLRHRAMDEAEGQTRRAAGTLHGWADDLAGLAENAPSDSPARSLAAQAADGGHRAADYLEKQGVEGVLSDVQGFARRRPAAFLGGALLAGLVVGRVMKAASKADTPSGASPGDGAFGAQRQAAVAASEQAALNEPRPAALPTASATGAAPGRPVPGV